MPRLTKIRPCPELWEARVPLLPEVPSWAVRTACAAFQPFVARAATYALS